MTEDAGESTADRELAAFLNDEGALDAAFARRSLPPGLVCPVGMRASEWKNLVGFLRGLTAPTVATVYLFLSLATVLVWLALGAAAPAAG